MSDSIEMPVRGVYAHRVHGTRYVLLGPARLQSGNIPALSRHEDTPMVAYVSLTTGKIHVRPTNEFFDGRFEEVINRPLERTSDSDNKDRACSVSTGTGTRGGRRL